MGSENTPADGNATTKYDSPFKLLLSKNAKRFSFFQTRCQHPEGDNPPFNLERGNTQ